MAQGAKPRFDLRGADEIMKVRVMLRDDEPCFEIESDLTFRQIASIVTANGVWVEADGEPKTWYPATMVMRLEEVLEKSSK